MIIRCFSYICGGRKNIFIHGGLFYAWSFFLRRMTRKRNILSVSMTNLVFLFSDYTEGAELVDAVLDVVRKEAEGTDCLQGTLTIFPRIT